MITKSVYEVPSLTKVGSLEAVTQAANGNGRLDAPFPASTPRGQLTFS